jgi:putative ubiquitin-RnfH superfamily antitoxin RatB of RatAB toxin-antitoxin module
MPSEILNLWLCDARLGTPELKALTLKIAADESATVGLALMQWGIAANPEDAAQARKGCFGVFGKRKDWDSPIYEGDRLELYAPLLIDPKMVRRKRANQNQDAKFQAAAAKRKARRL